MPRRHEELAARDKAFARLQERLASRSFAASAKAFLKWGRGMLRLSGALIKENDALRQALRERDAVVEGEIASLRERVAALERSATLDSTTSSKPLASDGLKKSSGTPRRTRSRRQPSTRPSGGQPGHKGTTLKRAANPDLVLDHDPHACGGCRAPLSAADRHGASSASKSSTCPSCAPSRSWNTAPTAASAPSAAP